MDFVLIQGSFVDCDMLMQFTGQGIGHQNTRSHTAAFREDLTAAYGSWVAEMEVVNDDVEEDEADDEDAGDDRDDESEVEHEDKDDSDWEEELSDEEEDEAFGVDENDDILAEEDEYGYAPL